MGKKKKSDKKVQSKKEVKKTGYSLKAVVFCYLLLTPLTVWGSISVYDVYLENEKIAEEKRKEEDISKLPIELKQIMNQLRLRDDLKVAEVQQSTDNLLVKLAKVYDEPEHKARELLNNCMNEYTSKYNQNVISQREPRKQMYSLMHFLFNVWGMKYTTNRKSPDQYHIKSLYEKVGNCLTMPLFVLAICEKMNFPVTMKMMNSHFVATWKSQFDEFNIECTFGESGKVGIDVKDSEYQVEFPTEEKLIENKICLSPMNKKEVLSLLFYTKAQYYKHLKRTREFKREDQDKALVNYACSLDLNHKLFYSVGEIGTILASEKRLYNEADLFFDYLDKLGANTKLIRKKVEDFKQNTVASKRGTNKSQRDTSLMPGHKNFDVMKYNAMSRQRQQQKHQQRINNFGHQQPTIPNYRIPQPHIPRQ